MTGQITAVRSRGVTIPVTMACTVCGRDDVVRSGRRRYCSDACRQAAHRRRQRAPVLPATRSSPRTTNVYECPSCTTRFVGVQRCDDCGIFCTRVGPGGPCPHCEEPVAIADLLAAGHLG